MYDVKYHSFKRAIFIFPFNREYVSRQHGFLSRLTHGVMRTINRRRNVNISICDASSKKVVCTLAAVTGRDSKPRLSWRVAVSIDVLKRQLSAHPRFTKEELLSDIFILSGPVLVVCQH